MQKEIENSLAVHWVLSVAGGFVITLAGFFIAMTTPPTSISRMVERWVVGWPERLLPRFVLDQDEGFLMLLLWNMLLYSLLTSFAIRLAKKYNF